MTKSLTTALCSAFVAATLFASPAARAAANSDRAYNMAVRLMPVIKKCWIDSGDAAFAGYVYSPEPNATNGPRILIVPRTDPSAPPALVIEISNSGGHVDVYGPLATSPSAPRISADLRRWLDGSLSCS